MRLGETRTATGPRLVAQVDGQLVVVAEQLADAPSRLIDLISAPGDWVDRIGALSPTAADRERQLELGPPLVPLGGVIAIGTNYHDLCRARNMDPPSQPVIFVKLPGSIIGDHDEISWSPELTATVDWESELGVVIGRTVRNVSEAEALDTVFGYTVVNDVTARDIQRSEQQWVRAKSLDTFCPMGPLVVTRDEIADPQDLAVRSWVNGKPMQDSSTAEMIFSVAELIAFMSRSFTLRAGDVIATGTPIGVGTFQDPPVFLADGDVVDVEVHGVGRLSNRCRTV